MENTKKELTQEERIAIIRAVVTDVATNGIKVDAEGQKLIQELQAEKATEELVVEHGLLNATKNDVIDEVNQLDSIEEGIDYDQDENEVDMTLLSPAMREALN